MATITWTGSAGDGNYNNPANWSPAQVPGVGDTVTISEAAATSINASNGAALSLTTSKSVTLNVNNQANFTFGSGSASSTFANAGTLALNSGNQATDLVVGGAKLTLSGGGLIVLSNNSGNGIVGAAAGDQLINTNNTIEGGGSIGSSLTLTNSAAGTINGDDSTSLVINTGTATVTNAGLLESTSGGALVLQSVISNGTSGHVAASGGTVYLQGADLQGGTLSSSGGFAVTVQSGYTGTLDGTTHAVDNTGLVDINNSGTLSVLGSIVNTGTIALLSSNQATDLVVGKATGPVGTVTLSGAGTLTLSDNGGNRIYGAQAGDTLVNQSTISGAGQFGIGAGTYTLGLTNSGTIDATGSNGLYINTGSTVTNSALLEATNPAGGLVLQATVNDSTGGTILSAGADVYLQGADIIGGRLNSSGAGVIVVQGGQSATLDGSTQTVTNAGQIDINNQGTINLLGTFTNTGTIALQSSNQATELVANTPTVTLTGGGVVALSDNSNNYIFGATAATVLDNVNNTIEGSGQIGDSQLTLVNAGTISATGTASYLYFNGDTLVTNTALIQALGAAGVVFQNTTVKNVGGTLSAGTSNIYLQNTTVQGGLLKTTAAHAVEIQGGQAATLDGSASTVTSSGTVQIDNQGTVTALGTLVNSGTISLNSTNQATEFVIGSPTLTLTGGGQVNLSSNGNNYIFGSVAADTLDNVNNSINGAGQLGDGQLTLINTLQGTINANQTTGLTLNTDGETVTNAGLIESTNSGGLAVVNTTIANTGTISANGGDIYLNGGTLQGGLLSAGNGGQYLVVNSESGTLDGSSSTVTLTGPLTVQNQSTISLLGTLLNETTLSLTSSNQDTDLIVGPATGSVGTVTLSGSGTVSLSDNGSNRIYGAQAANTLVNLNNTIEGAGQIGAGQLVLVNDSLIDATGNSGLYVNTGSTVTNNGVIEATNPNGGLVIQSRIDSSGGGTILAAGGNVYLQSGTLAGGLVNSSGGAVINVQGGQIGTLDGSVHALTNKGSIVLSNQGSLNIAGSIVNDGTISLQSSNQNTDLIVSNAAATLTGGGTITLSDNGGNRIYGATSNDVLDNVNNTIVGAGQIGAGQLTLINAGTIEQAGGNNLYLNTGGIAATNSGVLEATGSGGGLVLQTVVSNSGSILAAGGDVYLQSGTIQGGTLNSSGGASFIVQGNNSGTLDGSAHAVTNAGSFAIQNQGTLSVLGSLVNSGTIALQSSNQNTDLIIDSAKVTLSGGGTVSLSDNGGNRIYGAATANVLDNVDNTIEGSGQLGAGQLTLVDGGTIAATGGNDLVVNLGSTGTITATGQALGEGSGGLVFQNGTYTNSGLIQADNGSGVTFQSGAVLTNDSSAGTLTGGSYGAVSTGNNATLAVSSGIAVNTLAADLILSGAGSEITFGGTAIETSLTTISKTGQLQILNGRGLTAKNKLTSFGTVTLAGGTLKSSGLIDRAGSLFTGFGTLAASFTDSGSVVATGGELNLTGRANSIAGTVSGTGTVGFGGTTTLNTGTALSVGNIALLNKAVLNIATNVSFAGTFDVVGTGTVSGVGTFTNAGLFEATSKGVATIADPFVNTGTISVALHDSLAFSGGLTNTGLILDAGTFTDTAALTGGSLTTSGLTSSATIASAAGSPNSTIATLTTAGGTLNTSGTTLTVTGDYNNTGAGKGNSYNPFAGVTGTIDGQGTQLSVVGVNGTTISSVNGTLTIAIQPGGTAHFEIENTGAAGSAALRGALQTTVNGGTINGTALSGSGVTAANFGPIAGGGHSGIYTIAYSGGTLSGEAIHLASDFANVAGLTIDIVSGSGNAAPVHALSMPDVAHAASDWLPSGHHG